MGAYCSEGTKRTIVLRELKEEQWGWLTYIWGQVPDTRPVHSNKSRLMINLD